MQPMHNSKKDLSVFRPGTTTTGIAFQGADISNIYDPDYTSLSPRVGFSYQPAWSKGTVVRGGVGLFFDIPNANPFLDNRPGNSAPNGLEGNPGGSNPVVTLQPGRPNDRPRRADHSGSGPLSCPDPRTPAARSAWTRTSALPTTYNFSLQLEQSLGGKAFFQIGYVGSEGQKAAEPC